MAMQKRSSGNAHEKRNCWQRGNGSYSMRRICKTLHMVEFS